MQSISPAQISRKSFIQSFVILFILMVLAGVMTRVIPAGSFDRIEQGQTTVIEPGSFHLIDRPNFPIWRWFTAPIEVLGSDDGLTIITILVFLLMVGASFAVLQKCGIVQSVVQAIIDRFGKQKYLLLLVISLFFMILGGFFGIFEETVPMIPILVALAIHLGWDSLTGLGMSILAVNMGFSTAITNPFTIGVAQKLADLPLFSGASIRLVFFIIIYIIFAVFLVGYARKIEKDPTRSPVWELENKLGLRNNIEWQSGSEVSGKRFKRAVTWFIAFVASIAVILFATPFVDFLSSYSLPLVAVLFLTAGLGAGFLSGARSADIWAAAKDGALGIAPGIPLILMAVSIKFIVAHGGIMDTMLHSISNWFSGSSPFMASFIIYAIALIIEFFIGSGSAKAFLLMPILLPLADLVGVTRQTTVTAYCFGDGFSNLIYPTNPVLLISLGLTVVSFPVWLKWSLKLWLWVLPVTILFLAFASAIHFGPF